MTVDSDFRLTKCRREEKAARSSSNLQQEDGDQVIPDDFGDFLGNTTYLPGLPNLLDFTKYLHIKSD